MSLVCLADLLTMLNLCLFVTSFQQNKLTDDWLLAFNGSAAQKLCRRFQLSIVLPVFLKTDRVTVVRRKWTSSSSKCIMVLKTQFRHWCILTRSSNAPTYTRNLSTESTASVIADCKTPFTVDHRRRLLEMTVGQDFSSPFHFLLPSRSSSPSSVPSLRCPFPSCIFPFSFPYSYLHPLNPAKDLGESCMLLQGSRQRPAVERFWYIFRLKTAQLSLLA